MTQPTNERLYALIPAIYKQRDADAGYPLRALLAVLDTQVGALENDIARLYENWFIETCDPWVVPYIADLLAVKTLNPVTAVTAAPRAYVANVLSYRRRKGTAAMLEQLARDLTGWSAHAVEEFTLLTTDQHLNHLRPTNLQTPDLRDDAALGLIGGAFDPTARSIDVRRIATGRGRANIQNVALFLWRLEADPLIRVDATVAREKPAEKGLFRFSPLGQDVPLFNARRAVDPITELAIEAVVPGALRRRAMFDDLASFRAERASLGHKAPASSLYFGAQSAVTLTVDGVDLPVEALRICNLADWHHPPDVTPIPGAWPTDSVAIDPVLGRIAFAASVAPATPPAVTWYQGFSGPLGGGGYARVPTLPTPTLAPPLSGGGNALSLALDNPALSYVPVSEADQLLRATAFRRTTALDPAGGLKSPLADRLTELLKAAGRSCIVEINDSRTYSLGGLTVPPASTLEIRAADGKRPLVNLTSATAMHLGQGAVLIFNGLVLAGATLTIADAPEAAVVLQHCTLVPGLTLGPDGTPQSPDAPSVSGPAVEARFDLLVYRSITGPLQTSTLGADGYVFIEESVVDAMGGSLPAIATAHGSLVRATVLGAVDVETGDEISDSIVTGAVTAARVQEGCARFSFFPDGSRVSQPYRCQPAMALQTNASAPPAEQAARSDVLARVAPAFTSTRFGDPGYGQLTATCAPEIRRGASDEGSMGAFSFVAEPQRVDNLFTSLDEYLRFGLEAGIFFAS